MVLVHGVRVAASGGALGLVAALGAGHIMQSMLFGVTATDPATYLAVALGIGVLALVASYVPARRAARADPMTSLRTSRPLFFRRADDADDLSPTLHVLARRQILDTNHIVVARIARHLNRCREVAALGGGNLVVLRLRRQIADRVSS